MTFTSSVRNVIDTARTRHWSFTDLVLGDGAVLLNLSQRLRTHLAAHGAKIEGLVGTSMTYEITTVDGLLIAELNGVPQYTTTYQDGWPIHLDGFGVPYYDTTEPMIAQDPFGENGGTPGFPLPSDMVKLIEVTGVYANPAPSESGLIIPIDVVPSASRVQKQPGRNPIAFVDGNRLVPLFSSYPSSVNTGDRWRSISRIILNYVALPTLTSLDQVLAIPSVLVDALIADMALLMARQAKECPPADRLGFERDAVAAAGMAADAALDMVGEPQNNSVVFLG